MPVTQLARISAYRLSHRSTTAAFGLFDGGFSSCRSSLCRALHTSGSCRKRIASISGLSARAYRLDAPLLLQQTGSRLLSSKADLASSPAINKTSGTSKSATRSTPATATAAASVSRHQQAKVEVLPFRVSTEGAEQYLKTLATTEILPRVMGRWELLGHRLMTDFGLSSWLKRDKEEIVKMLRISPLYLPTWVVDASFEMKCRGNDGRADATVITTSSRFPGHSWKPMDTMPMIPPPPFDMVSQAQKDPSISDRNVPKADWDNLALVDYEPFESFSRRAEFEGVDIEGGIPEPIPFTISPLHLPEMLRTQLELKDYTFAPDLAAGIALPGSDKHGLGVTVTFVGEDGEQLSSAPVRFEPDTFKLDLLAAYPILMPLYMAEFSYVDSEEEEHRVTFVLGAWDAKGLQFCMKEQDQDWQWSFFKSTPMDIDQLDIYPRVPVKSSFTEMFEKERELKKREREAKRAEKAKELAAQEEQDGDKKKKRKTLKEWEEEWDREILEDRKSFNQDIGAFLQEKIMSELPIKAAIEEKSLELLKAAEWEKLERQEREDYLTRVSEVDPMKRPMSTKQKERYRDGLNRSLKHPTEPKHFAWLSDKADRMAEETHPDRRAGLGRYIHWTSPHIQRLSHNVYANRRYLNEGIPDVLQSRKRMMNIIEAGGSIETSMLAVKVQDGTKRSGDDAWQTVSSRDLDARQHREALKPRWLKNLEGSSAASRSDRR